MGPARLTRVLIALTSVPYREVRVPGGCRNVLCLKMFRSLPMMMSCSFKMVHGIAMMLDRSGLTDILYQRD